MARYTDNMLLADAKKDFKEFYNIPDGVNPKTRKKYLTEALENYEGFDDASKLFSNKQVQRRSKKQTHKNSSM